MKKKIIKDVFTNLWKGVMKPEAASEELKKQGVSDAAREACMAALEKLKPYKDEIPEGILRALMVIAGADTMPDETVAEGADKKPDEAAKAAADKAAAAIKSADLALLPEPMRKAVETLQAQVDDQKARVEKAEKEAKDARTDANLEKELRLKKEMVDYAEDLEFIEKDANKLGALLHRIKGRVEKADYDELAGILERSNARLEKSELFVEKGFDGENGEDANDPEAKVKAMAKALIEKDSKLSEAQAIERVYRQNPELEKAVRENA